MEKLYLAGKITGDLFYKQKFGRIAGILRKQGYSIMNPAVLPDGYDYEDYIKVCTVMIDVNEGVAFMPDWTDSPGAKYEMGHAVATGKEIIFLDDEGNIQASGYQLCECEEEA